MTDEQLIPLFDLFQEEVRTHGDVLRDLLATWLTQPVDPDAIVRAAHSIHGAARIVGLVEAAQLASRLEAALNRQTRAPGAGAHAALGVTQAEPLMQTTELLTEFTALSEHDALTWPARHADTIASLTAQLDAMPGSTPARNDHAAASSAPTGDHEWARESSVPRGIDGLGDLFRAEVETHVRALSDGLVALEADPTHSDTLSQIMRAAHSIKGAARVLGVEGATRLAHAIEDCFVAAGAGRIVVDAGSIDTMLEATDLLARLADGTAEAPARWERAHADAIERLERTCAAIALGQGPSLQVRGAERVPPLVANLATAAVDAAPAAITRVAGAQSGLKPGAGEVNEATRSLRVHAPTIQRLVGLASEMLVDSRRVAPYATTLRGIVRRMDRLIESVEMLRWRQLTADDLSLIDAALERLKDDMLACREQAVGVQHDIGALAYRNEENSLRLYRDAMTTRMRPFADGVHGFPRMVRDVARQLNKTVEFVIEGGNVGVDREILEKLEAPLNHLLRNALDHGIEGAEERVANGKPARATLRLVASHRGGMLTIDVHDDGRGIDVERIRRRVIERGWLTPEAAASLSTNGAIDYLFKPGFSTADSVTEISGRGVGLDVVLSSLRDVDGSVRVTTHPGRGTEFHLTLPVTRSVLRAVVASVAGEPHAFPLARIDCLIQFDPDEVTTSEGRPYVRHAGRNVGLVSAASVLGLGDAPPGDGRWTAVVIGSGDDLCGLVVDRLLGEHDLVVLPLDPRLGKVADIAAASILPDGDVVLIVDIDDIRHSVRRAADPGSLRGIDDTAAGARKVARRVLVVDDSVTVREIQRHLLLQNGFDVVTATDGRDAWRALQTADFDLIVSDVDMPRMNGLELARSVKQDARLRHVPFMIVSYREHDDDRSAGLAAGADVYIAKSEYDIDGFLHAVQRLLAASTTSP